MWFYKHTNGLIAAEADSEKQVGKMDQGELVNMRVVRVRSIKWHRWYFGCCKEIGLLQEPERLTPTIDYAIRFWSGHVEEIRDKTGRVMEVAKRIAFDQLEPDQWAALWPSFEKTMIEKFGFDPVKFKEQGNGTI